MPVAEGANQSDYYNLIDHLFTDYRTDVRPVTDDSNSTKISIAFWLQSITDLDEKNQIISTAVILQLEWYDQWLHWDPSGYGGITKLRYPQEKLWLPDVIVSNSVLSQTQLGYKESPCVIDSNGIVEWRPSEIMKTSCDMDITYYPFDQQTCSVILSTWVSETDDIELDLDYSVQNVILDRYSPSGTWDLIATSMQVLPTEHGIAVSRINYSFKLKRLNTFYVLNLVLPILLLSLTASAVFYLPAETGEKMGMSMTVLLAFAVYLTIISDNMPQTSLQVSILSVYLGLILGVCGVSVVMSVFILHLHHSPQEKLIGKKTMAFTRAARKIVCTGHRHSNPRTEANHTNNNGTHDDGSPKKTRSLIDPLEKCVPENCDTQYTINRRNKVAPEEDKSRNIDPNNSYVDRETEEEEQEITWPVVAETLDSVFFFMTSICIITSTIIVMSVFAYKDNS